MSISKEPKLPTRRLLVRTGCASIDEFVSRYSLYATESSIGLRVFAPELVGARHSFALLLTDRSSALSGIAVFSTHDFTRESPAARGLLLTALELDGPSRQIHRRLLRASRDKLPVERLVLRAARPVPAIPERRPLGIEPVQRSSLDSARFFGPIDRPQTPSATAVLPTAGLALAGAWGESVWFARAVATISTWGRRVREVPIVLRARSRGGAIAIAACLLCLFALWALSRAWWSPQPATGLRIGPEGESLKASSEALVSAPKSVGVVDPTSNVEASPGCWATIGSEPQGATVFWNEIDLGQTPLVGIDVPCGRALVRWTLRRFHRHEIIVSAVSGSTTTATTTLKRRHRRLWLTSDPTGAEFSVNGRIIGKAPTEVEVPTYESAQVVVRKPGFHRQLVTVRGKGDDELVHAQLVPTGGDSSLGPSLGWMSNETRRSPTRGTKGEK